MEAADLITIGLVVVGFGLVSGRLEGTPLTPPMVFIAAGVVLASAGRLDVDVEEPLVRGIMEITLVVVLFTDASRIDLRTLSREFSAPLRMLTAGLLLTVVAGTLLAAVLLPGLGVWGAAVLAVVLAPTDAALGQAVVSDATVPRSVRQTLNVESGLNDGLALPLLAIGLALAGAVEEPGDPGSWVRLAASEIGIALAVGVGLAYVTGVLIVAARARGWMATVFLRLSGVTLALVSYGVADAAGGSGFLAAFVAGAVLGNVARSECAPIHAFAEAEGQLLVLTTFLLFGAIAVVPAFERLDWRALVYAVGSLTVVRMVPVAVSLAGSGLRRATVWFLAWFGPRGLASILFGLLVLEASGIPSGGRIFDIVVVTVTASAFAHGVTAAPLARRYGREAASFSAADMPEMMDVAELPTRLRWSR